MKVAYGSLFAHPNEVGVELQLVRLCYKGHPRFYYILINCPEPNELNRDRLLYKAPQSVFFSVRRWGSNLTDLAVQEFNFLITQMHEKIKNKIKKTFLRNIYRSQIFLQLYHLYTFSNYTQFTGSWELTFNFEVKWITMNSPLLVFQLLWPCKIMLQLFFCCMNLPIVLLNS